MSGLQQNLSSFALVGNLDLNTAHRASQPPGILSQLSTQNLLERYASPQSPHAVQPYDQKSTTPAPRRVFRVADYLDESDDDANVSVENSDDFRLVPNLVSVRLQIIGQNQQLAQMDAQLDQFLDFIESHKRNIKRLYQNQVILKETISGVYENSE